ncbi:MAG: Kynurenine formamidase [Chlamydiae bacterium]|nr:Kynurenine formamidase [Chlamydiota bacterium]
MSTHQIDLTHTLNDKIPTWTGRCSFYTKVLADYNPAKVMRYQMNSASGTHMDAPAHFMPDGLTIEAIPIENLIVPLYVIDVTQEAHPDFFLTPNHIAQFEKAHGKIAPNSFVVAYTGWQERWSTPHLYRNVDSEGNGHYPGFSAESAQLLLEREIAGIGIDTLNPDGNNQEYPVHYAILGAGKYIVENLTNLDKVPASGAQVALLPLKIEGAPEAPIRAVALLN